MSLLGLDIRHDKGDRERHGNKHELDGEVQNLLLYYSLTCRVINYFQTTHMPADNPYPSVPKSFRMFASSTTATVTPKTIPMFGSSVVHIKWCM